MERKEKAKGTAALKEIGYDQILIKDKILVRADMLELRYLFSLEPDRLLAGFLEQAGLKPKAKRYDGWEVKEIQGHTLGHYLTAISQAYGTHKDIRLLERIDYIVSELHKCQREDGYLFAWKEEIFDRVENLKPAWVPWYTMHKILSGLLSAYQYTGNQEAFTVMYQLGFWIYNRCRRWTPSLQATVLTVEYGGMNDGLYELYQVTGEKRFAEAAHCFDELTLFVPIFKGGDILKGLHANTTIPKILGALKRYVVFGEEFYLTVAKKFWEMVINHHTYITGGNSEWEHFGEPNILDEERTACNCETCNTHNMLKLTKLLFQITKEKKYADYYEKAFLNTILSSQNPKDGMTTYFQPMATGYFKVYATPYHSFWCCTGIGMENFTKLSEGTVFYEKDTVYINRFYDAEISLQQLKAVIELKADFLQGEEIEIKINRSNETETQEFTLAIRLPDWLQSKETIRVNEKEISYIANGGYAFIKRRWNTGDVVILNLPMALRVHTLPDNHNTVAFTYGPFVLSAGLGKQMLDTTYTGVAVLVPTKEVLIPDYILIPDVDIEVWKRDIHKHLVKTFGKIEFTLHAANHKILVFTPHFARHEERYGIYYRLFKNDSKDFKVHKHKFDKKEELKKLQIDTIPLGNDQYESAHRIKGHKTNTAMENGYICRYIKEDGWLSYELTVISGTQLLCLTYCSLDEGNEFDIYLNDSLFIHEKVTGDEENMFYTKVYYIPAEIIGGSHKVTVKFKNKDSRNTCRIYDELYIRRQ